MNIFIFQSWMNFIQWFIHLIQIINETHLAKMTLIYGHIHPCKWIKITLNFKFQAQASCSCTSHPQEAIDVMEKDITTLKKTSRLWSMPLTLLHIVPFCEGPNKKLEGFAKQKQSAIFAMRHASQLVMHHPSLIYNVPLIIAALLRHIQQKKLCDPLSLCPP